MSLRRKLIVVLVTCLFPYAAGAAYSEGELSKHKFALGFELDALPYLTGGYYFSLWGGYDGWRFRGVVSRVNIPKFLIPDGFQDLRTDAYALIVDYFLGWKREEFKIFWAGTGLEYWKNRIRRKGFGDYARYDAWEYTLGGGYVWKILGNLYLNPWAVAHLRIAGDKSTDVSGKTYESALLNAEISLKIGYHF